MGYYPSLIADGRGGRSFWKRHGLLRAFLAYLVSITLVFPAWIFSSIAPREAFASTPPDPAEYTVNSVPGYFVDISTTGTRVLPQLVDEDAKGAVPIGFDIEYFGRPFNSVTITSNGYLTFGIDIEPGNTPLPSTAGPDSLIAVFWDDLDPSLNPSADIYYETQGAAPDRRFIVTWKEIPLKADPASRLTFQTILFEGSNEIQYQYLSMTDSSGTTGAGRVSGSSASIGIENIDGTKGKQLAFNQNGTIASGSAFSFTLAGNAHQEGRPLGDLNGDGMLTVNDQYFLARQYLGDLALNTSPMLSLSDLAPDPGADGRAFGDGVIDGQDNTRLVDAVMRRLDLNPLISDVSYITANSGETLTILGSGFDRVAGNNSVRFVKADGSEIAVDAESVNTDGSELLVTVPAGTQFVSIYIEQGGLISNTSDFAIEGSPTITILTPDLEAPGNSVHIRGYEFGFAPGDNQVSFNNIPATVFSADTGGAYDELIVTVPGGVSSGLVTVTTAGETSNGVMFTLDEPPVLAIETPDDKDEVIAITDIIGTVEDVNLAAYTVEIARVGGEFSSIAGGLDNVSDDVLGKLDPTLQLNGIYTLRLTAWDENANTSTVTKDFLITGKNKPGAFTLSFMDLHIPVSGVPIMLNRIYDSRNKTKGDFGVGWDLDISTGSFSHNRTPGEGWYFRSSPPPFPQPCQRVSETLPHITEVRLSDFESYYFALGFSNMYATLGGCYADANFEFVNGTSKGAVLQIVGNTEVLYQNGSNRIVDSLDGSLYSPRNVRLATLDGRVFDFDIDDGLTRIQDKTGNSLTITSTGVFHSSGKAISFTRDSMGRITRITDPVGNALDYEYDVNGDLIEFRDREDNPTEFVYDSDHYLVDIIADSVQVVRNEYDENGRHVAVVDSDGNRVENIHDLDSQTEIIIENGYVQVVEYDNRGNVTRRVDEEGGETRWTFDSNDNILSETSPINGTTSFTYDTNGYLVSQTDPLGNVWSYIRSAAGKLLSVTDSLSNTTNYDYDPSGNLVEIEDALNNKTTYAYDSSGNVLSLTDKNGNATQYEYDASGNKTKVTDALGNEVVLTYDLNGNRLSHARFVTTPSGVENRTTAWSYDANGNVLAVIGPDNNQVNYQYNTGGKRVAVINPIGQRTDIDYNAAGKTTSVVFNDGLSDNLTYERFSLIKEHQDRSGRVKKFNYDRADRPVEILLPDGTPGNDADNPKYAVAYNPSGLILSQLYLGTEIQYEYDLAGRRTLTRDPLGGEIALFYDKNGNSTGLRDALGRTATAVNDALGRNSELVLPDGTTIRKQFDANDNVTATIDQLGNVTRYEYDGLNRLIAVIDPLGNRTSYVYDEVGNVILQTDANGNSTSIEYNAYGQKTAMVLPLGQRAEYQYDLAGRLLRMVDFNQDEISYEYDDFNRLSATNYPDGTAVEYTYTPAGKKETVLDSRGTTSFSYDVNDRMLSRTEPDGSSITYTYNENGTIATVTTPVGVVRYTYDTNLSMNSVIDHDLNATTFEYDAVGNLTRIDRPNGVVETRTYDAMDRVTLLENRDSGGAVVSSYAYTFDGRGNRTSVIEHTGRRVDYVYDAINRLVSETITDPFSGVRAVSYTYDSVGNRLTRNDSEVGVTTYNYDENNRLTREESSVAIIDYSYDENGNILSEGDAVNYAIEYSWNAENRLAAATVTDDVGNSKALSFSYNEEGLRVSTEEDGVVKKFLLDTTRTVPQVVEEYAANGSNLASYVYGNNLVSKRQGSQQHYYLQDMHSGVRQLSDVAGSITDFYDYDAYGRLLGSAGLTVNNYLYRGEQMDSDIEKYYLRARYYDQNTGRFLGRDPYYGKINDPVSLHKYLYANANPVTYLDPTGQFTMLEMAISSVIIGLLQGSTAVYMMNSIPRLGYGVPAWLFWDVKLTNETIGWGAFSIGGIQIEATSDCIPRGDSWVGKDKATWEAIVVGVGIGTGSASGAIHSLAKRFKKWAEAIVDLDGQLDIGGSGGGLQMITPGDIGLTAQAFAGNFLMFDAAVALPVGGIGVGLTVIESGNARGWGATPPDLTTTVLSLGIFTGMSTEKNAKVLSACGQ